MRVLYVTFGSTVRPGTFGCIVMGSSVLFILRSRLLVYSAGSGVNRVQVDLSEFCVRLFYFVQAKMLCISLLHLWCVDVMVVVVVVDLPLLRVDVEGSDNPISLEKPC